MTAKSDDKKPCKYCHGTGTVWLEGSIHGEDVCPKCHGTRLIGYDDCSGADCQDCGYFISEDEMRCRNENHQGYCGQNAEKRSVRDE